MTKNLMIVESPTKAKKIGSILGDGWRVEACVGHICDLPLKSLGVDEKTFVATYELSERGENVVKKLAALAKNSDRVWLATDPDREGESISWHLARFLKLKNYHRVRFNEITEKAIRAAISVPTQIDMSRVEAQEARRILDRLVGYLISPSISKAVGEKLSAGRVQSVAVRLCVEREEQIKGHHKIYHYGVHAAFDCIGESKPFRATWQTNGLFPDNNDLCLDKSIATRVAQLRNFVVLSSQEKEEAKAPPPPFITTTLMKVANQQFKWSAEKTMKVAQWLFQTGHITYHRTDNPNFSDDGHILLREYLKTQPEGKYLSSTPYQWKTGADAQEAHEAIRPTHPELVVLPELSGEQGAQELYTLIRRRALSCQMKKMCQSVRELKLISTERINELREAPIFVAKGRRMLDPGWSAYAGDIAAVEKESNRERDDDLAPESWPPLLPETTPISAIDGVVTAHETKPPRRYTEATLIKELERRGIGRPSSYATILSNIKNRTYINVKKNGSIEALHAGFQVRRMIVGNFAFGECDYTRRVEADLDAIAKGELTRLKVLEREYSQLNRELGRLLCKG